MRLSVASIPARPAKPAERSPARPEVAAALRLQRSIGNRGTCALLRRVRAAHPTPMSQRRGEFAQITKVHHPGGLNGKEWRDTLAAAKAALDAGDLGQATALYTTLYRDLAATAGAVSLRDVASGIPINLAKSRDEGFAPGLNLVLGSGGSKNGSTAFVDAGGKFGVPFSIATKTGRPGIAIRLFAASFSADKAMTLAVLRHEMLHAHHHEQALDALKGKPKSAVDKVLVREITQGGASNTELLAYIEGFMTAFHLIDPAPGTRHAVFLELLGALDTSKIDPWAGADESVRDEALGRLHEYYCNTLDAAHRAAFDAWVAEQEAQIAKDAEALRAGTSKSAIAVANRNVERMFEHFVLALKEVASATCPAVSPRGRPAPAGRSSAA